MWPNADETRELLLQAEKGGNEAIDRLLSRHRQALRRMVELRLDRALARRVAPVISSRTRFSKPAAGLNPTLRSLLCRFICGCGTWPAIVS